METLDPGGLCAQASNVRLEQRAEGGESPQRGENTDSLQHGEGGEPPRRGGDEEPPQHGSGNRPLQEERGGDNGDGMKILHLRLPESTIMPATSSGVSRPMAEDPHPSSIPPRSPAQVSNTVLPSDHTSSRTTAETP